MPGNNQACALSCTGLSLLSPWAATTEARVPGARVPQEKPAHHQEVAPAHWNKRKPAHISKAPVQPIKKLSGYLWGAILSLVIFFFVLFCIFHSAH